MKTLSNQTIYIMIGSLLLIGIIVLIVISRKKQNPEVNSTDNTANNTNCEKYTSAMQTRDLSQIRSKCYAKLLIPIVGVGSYNKCVTDSKATLPYIGDCI